jgi:heme-binding protein
MIAVALVVVAVVIQAVPHGRDHVNPPVRREPAWDSAETRLLARRACFDCHSNETRWPWWSHVAPASWIIEHDIEEARAVLNFSDWQRPSPEVSEAAETVLSRDMPPWMYALAHGRLTSSERVTLAAGLAATVGREQRGAGRLGGMSGSGLSY